MFQWKSLYHKASAKCTSLMVKCVLIKLQNSSSWHQLLSWVNQHTPIYSSSDLLPFPPMSLSLMQCLEIIIQPFPYISISALTTPLIRRLSKCFTRTLAVYLKTNTQEHDDAVFYHFVRYQWKKNPHKCSQICMPTNK